VVRELPETTYAVLGLLDKQPSSGYDLAALADRALGYFWPISRTLVYRELARLDSLGWASSEQVSQDRLPDKRVWSTTPAGQEALVDWLNQPAVAGSGNRNGFLLKFFLGARMSPEARRALLDDYRAALESTRTDLAGLAERLARVPNARMGRLSALHGLRTAEARLAWLDEIEPELTELAELPTSGPREHRGPASPGQQQTTGSEGAHRDVHSRGV
jgi:DNA-binding PadR family transcriptional regulator